jgi:DNA-binding XRE family transcriptional regulator
MQGMGRKSARKVEVSAGPELLKKWRGPLKQQEAADLIGIDLARYNAFEHDRARPGLDWAFKIEEATRGEVPAESWAREPKALAAS